MEHTTPGTHLFLSPHYDDAVLSCGGAIAELVSAGRFVVVFNVFSEHAAPPYSPAAEALHTLWGSPLDVGRLRRAEDAAALARLGARAEQGDLPEVLYRRDREGRWLYHDHDAITGPRHPDDDALVTDISRRILSRPDLTGCMIYAPLGIGENVDHCLVFDAAMHLAAHGLTVRFYEDFPYSLDQPAYRRRVAALAEWSSLQVTVSRRSLIAKIESFAYYRSQIQALFGGDQKMRMSFIQFAKSTAERHAEFAERHWIPPAGGAPVDRE